MADNSNHSKRKWIGGVLHTISSDGDLKPDFNETIYTICLRIYRNLLILAVIINLILVEEYRTNFISFPSEIFLFPPVSILIIYFGTMFFHLIMGHLLQINYAGTNQDTGIKELLPFKLAVTKFFLGGLIVNAFYTMLVMVALGLEHEYFFLLLFMPVAIFVSVVMAYLEHREYDKVLNKWTAYQENE